MKASNCNIMKREILDMIKCLNSSDLRINDKGLYYALGAKASLFIELLNEDNGNSDDNSKFDEPIGFFH
ncbi:hypothetical protein [Fluviispira multicolorata]|uniref:Uncharacterized protein n=1 Tax=Fluviispira multicolorata TaxID=2654512 RepID=A0A833N640_9BACT|nr:hypothetical protein [Fluviispira multicolorata]KAB8032064.1 hypothetical protein GCL57_05295 [Fluviispira multicolorata]